MNFEELTRAIADAQVMAKSLSAAPVTEDKKVVLLTTEGGGGGGEDDDADGDGDGDADGDDDGDGDGDTTSVTKVDKPLKKSFRLQLDDGSEMEAFDGTELIEQLTARIDVENGQFFKSFGDTLEVIKTLAKSLNDTRSDLAETRTTIETQTETIEALQKSIKTLSTQGRGRVSTLSVIEKPTGKTVEPAAPTRGEVMAKCREAFSSKRITGQEATRVEAALNAGIAPQKEILDRIFAA